MLKSIIFHDVKHIRRLYQHRLASRQLVLGIETSCDDTGCAIVDNEGNILGEALHSQHDIHLKHGGIIPPIAQDLHRRNIENVVKTALKNAQVTCSDVNAVAVTVKPGLPRSLDIGTKYAKHLCRKYDKPLIPIHHMQAHALTARMIKKIEFPFLVLLISGGHCLLSIVKDIDTFYLLGESLNDAPGEVFDKAARRMKLKYLPEYCNLSGGQAIELAASKCTDPLRFTFPIPMLQYRDCNFSFAGLKSQIMIHINREEEIHNLPPSDVIPDINDLCAGFQLVIARHLCHRVQRGMEFAEQKGYISSTDSKTLVVSGGAACNNFIAKALGIVCQELDYELVRPPKKLCTDNGVMIAWNGMERWLANIGITKDYDSIKVENMCPLGPSIIDNVRAANLAVKWVKLKSLQEATAFR